MLDGCSLGLLVFVRHHVERGFHMRILAFGLRCRRVLAADANIVYLFVITLNCP
jgi:hypothetical protein